jgi:hypothetical protein
METPGTCPRGHAVAPDAVLCTVCWVRLDGEDPVSKRARILNLVAQPKVAAVAGGIVLAAGVGASLILANPTAPPSVVAEQAPRPAASPSPVTSSSPGPSSTAQDQPVVTSVPLAATIVTPVVTSPDGACRLKVLDQQVTCLTEGELVRFEVCVPSGTSSVDVRTRPSAEAEWTDVAADIVLLPGGDCASDGVRADVALAADAFTVNESRWRLVGRDDSGDKLWKSRLRPEG